MCIRCCLAVFILMSGGATTCFAQPDEAPVYPDTTWMQYATPEDAGWSSQKIVDVKAFADSLGSDAVMLIHNGAVVDAWGHNESVEFIASMYKSLFNALYGIAVAEGTIDTTDTLKALGIDAKPSLTRQEAQARVIHLLSASSGVYRPVRGAAQRSVQPGESWAYNGWDFHVLGTIYEQETGENVFEAFETRVAEPIGMQDYAARWGHYFSQPWRSDHPSYNIWMSARDLARFGLLYLRNGRWEGEQIIPSSWIKTTRQPRFRNVVGQDLAVHYGLLWWVRGGPFAEYEAYFASGVGNQSVWVLPELDVVFVHRASRDFNQGVYGLDVEDILLRLIEARTGPPVDQPSLIPMATTPH